jgi:opacity protein-like surface antigen
MKKFALAVVIAAVAASPAMAAKKKKAPAAEPNVWTLNDSGRRFLVDSFPIYYPSVVKMAIYSTPAAAPAGKKKK